MYVYVYVFTENTLNIHFCYMCKINYCTIGRQNIETEKNQSYEKKKKNDNRKQNQLYIK